MALKSPRNWFTSKPKGPNEECLACTEEFQPKQLVEAPCAAKHKYCGSCFENLVKYGCQNESSFPPKCCSEPIPRKLAQTHTSSQTRKSYDIMDAIARIQPGDRWYCPNPRCCKVFDINHGGFKSNKGVRCPACHDYICVLCRRKAHSTASDCDDDALRQTLITSAQKGWRTCPRCKEMIELKEGCRHIACRCGGQFCYVCGQVWGRCLNSHDCAKRLEHVRTTQRNANAASGNANQAGVNNRPPTPHVNRTANTNNTNQSGVSNRPPTSLVNRMANTNNTTARPLLSRAPAIRNNRRPNRNRNPAAEIARTWPELQNEALTEQEALRLALVRSAEEPILSNAQYESVVFTEAIARSLMYSQQEINRLEVQRLLNQGVASGMAMPAASGQVNG